ncbi:MAG: hypothetical protein H6550_15850 [Chitinophagales bacterium]|nr:hypothetical protein [Chitinophagales bacterium]
MAFCLSDMYSSVDASCEFNAFMSEATRCEGTTRPKIVIGLTPDKTECLELQPIERGGQLENVLR